MRGPGDLFGIRQSGLLDFKIGDVYQDADLLKKAEVSAKRLLAEDENLEKPEHEALKAYVEQAMGNADFRTI